MPDREDYKFSTADKLINTKTVTAQASAPTGTTDAANNVAVNTAGKKGVRYLNIAGLSRNAADDGDGAADVIVFPYFYFPDALGANKWRPGRGITIYREAEVIGDTDGLKGNVYQIVKPSGATRFGFATNAAFGGDTVLHLDVSRDT